MNEMFAIHRTTTAHADFQLLVTHLDNELWNELKEDQATYEQYNKVPDIKTAVILYYNNTPVAIGCFKVYNTTTVEIKRMFVEKVYRGKCCSKQILTELEKWATEEGYSHAMLETSIHFMPARALYTNAGYKIIANYGQYAGLKESVCMKKHLFAQDGGENKFDASTENLLPASEIEAYRKFLNPTSENRSYFNFEEDFIEDNVRCIPMIVRFKMDAAGIKLKLAEWKKFKSEEKIELALLPASTDEEAKLYNTYLSQLIEKYTGNKATALLINTNPDWANLQNIPVMLSEKAKEFNLIITPAKWQQLTNLQRFALLKLCRPGHENKNFPKAIKEFNLL